MRRLGPHRGKNYVETPNYFFATLPGQTETFTFKSAVEDVGIYLGSLDAANKLTLHLLGGGTEVFAGNELAGISGETLPIPGGTPTITGTDTNGRFLFKDPYANIVSITVQEGSSPVYNSFEIAQITTSVPESSTWAMLAFGFMGLGVVGVRKRRISRAIV